MTYLFPNYARKSIEFIEGQGNYLFDQTGKKYLDFTSGIGVISVGYNQSAVKASVAKQMDLIWHTPNLYQNSLQETVAKQLIGQRDFVAYFCNSGAEANEAALKLVRKATQKSKIITFQNSFHGRTFGSMSATGQAKIHEGFGALVPDFTYVPFNDLAALEAEIDQETAGIMLELVQGEGGVLPADKTWVQEVQKLCKKHQILFVIDEVQTGIGRTGALYAYETFDLDPDIITLAKGLGNGLPVGAMLGKTELAPAFGPGTHGSTFGGNKIALASATAVLEIVDTPTFLADVQDKGAFLLAELTDKVAPLKNVSGIRGIGLMQGIAIEGDLNEVVQKIEDQGLVVLKAGTNVIRLLPPLTITKAEIAEGVAIIAKVLG